MAPTWLPKSHSPTAIKAAKSWIYSHYILCGECAFAFLCICTVLWCASLLFCEMETCTILHLVSFLVFCRCCTMCLLLSHPDPSLCIGFAIESFLYPRTLFNTLGIDLVLVCTGTKSKHISERRNRKKTSTDKQTLEPKPIEFYIPNPCHFVHLYKISDGENVIVCVWMSVFVGFSPLAWKWTPDEMREGQANETHRKRECPYNDQSTKEYSTERDEVH